MSCRRPRRLRTRLNGGAARRRKHYAVLAAARVDVPVDQVRDSRRRVELAEPYSSREAEQTYEDCRGRAWLSSYSPRERASGRFRF
jgi:hypothetical protein